MVLAILIALIAFVQAALSQCDNGGSYWDGSSGTECKYCICGDPTRGTDTTCYSESEMSTTTVAYISFTNNCETVKNNCANSYIWATAEQCGCPKCPVTTSTSTTGTATEPTEPTSSSSVSTTHGDTVTTTKESTTTGNGNTNTNTMYSSSSSVSTTWSCANTYAFKYMDGMCTWCTCTTTDTNAYAYECRSKEQLTDTDVSRIKERCQLTCDSAYWKWSSDANHCCPYCEQSTSTTTTHEPYTTSTCPYNEGYKWEYDSSTATCKFYYCDSPGSCSVCDGTTTSTSNSYDYDRFWIAKYCGLEHCANWQYPSPTTSTVDGTSTSTCQCPTCEDETPYTTKPGYNCYDEWTLEYVSSSSTDDKYCAYCYCYDASASVNHCWPYSTTSTEYMYKTCPQTRYCAYEKLIWDNDCTCPSCPSDATTTKVDSSNTGTGSGDSTTSGSTSVNCENADSIKCGTYNTDTEPSNQPRLIFQVWINTDNVWDSRSEVWATLKKALDDFLTKYGLSLSDVLQYFYIRDWGVKCWYNNAYIVDVDPNNHCDDDIKTVDDTTFTGSASGERRRRRLEGTVDDTSITTTKEPTSTSSSSSKRCTLYISIGVYPGSESAVESIVQIIKNHFSDIPFDYKNYAVDVAVSYDTYGFIRAAIQEAEYTQYDANGNVVSTGRTGSDSSKLMINFICLFIVLIITMVIML